MSGGGRRGEVRVRKAMPVEKSAGGTHNRKARRAAKAQGVMFTEKSPEEQLWQSLLAAQKRDRARREANPVPFDQNAYDAEYHGDPWPDHIPMAPCIEAALEAAKRYEALTPREFAAEGVRLANILAFEGSEHLTCDTGKLTRKETVQKAEQVAALGQALGLGSCVPGGIKFCGIWLETVNGETAARVLVEKSVAKELAACG